MSVSQRQHQPLPVAPPTGSLEHGWWPDVTRCRLLQRQVDGRLLGAAAAGAGPGTRLTVAERLGAAAGCCWLYLAAGL